MFTEDDADSPHASAADDAIGLTGAGPSGYLDVGTILAAVKKSGVEMIHPGYGFLSESAAFARAVTAAGRIFVGSDDEPLDVFDDKSVARRAAITAGLPLPDATGGPSGIKEIRAFFIARRGGIMLKAPAGGGGRGLRAVRRADQLDEAYRRCAAEARLGFGVPAVLAEELVEDARHIGVQIVADGIRPMALGDRDCSIQRHYRSWWKALPRRSFRRRCAPGCTAPPPDCALRSATGGWPASNSWPTPRIQVEHTVTEEVTGLDLVAVPFALAGGASFDTLGLPAGVVADAAAVTGRPAVSRGIAIQCRVNAETVAAEGSVRPTAGTLTTFTPPSGPGGAGRHLRSCGPDHWSAL